MIGAVLVLLLLAVPASASVKPSWPTRAAVAAGAYWHATPGCGVPTVDLAWSDGGVSGGITYYGTGGVPTCVFGIDASRNWTWATYCTATLHEWGHILGHEHSEGGIMDGDGFPAVPYVCKPRTTRFTAVASRATHHKIAYRLAAH